MQVEKDPIKEVYSFVCSQLETTEKQAERNIDNDSLRIMFVGQSQMAWNIKQFIEVNFSFYL